MRVAAFTKDVREPSARFRVRQLIPYLATLGVEVEEFFPSAGGYPPPERWRRPWWAARSFSQRLSPALRARNADVVLLQRELLSTVPTIEPWLGPARIFDIDDAVFLHKRGSMWKWLARRADHVVCGNDYLADWFSDYCVDVSIIPTGVDAARYVPAEAERESVAPFVIGWIGTAGNLRYVKSVAPALRMVMEAVPEAILRVVSSEPTALDGVPVGRVEFVPWSEASEISAIQGFDVGIMPLDDTPWSRGKCSFKMLQYMSCGKAVVVSPVGMNGQVLRQGEVGIGPRNIGEWAEALVHLAREKEVRVNFGQNGRHLVEAVYDAPIIAGQLACVLKRVSVGKGVRS